MNFLQRVYHKYFPSPLTWAFFFGLLTCVFAFISLLHHGNYQWKIDISCKGFGGFTDLMFNSVRLLFMEPPEDVPTESTLYSFAQIFAVCFAITGVTSLLWLLSAKFRDFLRRCHFRLMRRNQEPAIIIGLGRIGLPLAEEIRKKGRPVYAIELSTESDNLKKAKKNKILVIEGDATDSDTFERVPLRGGSEIFIVTGDDARNIEIGGLLQDLPLPEGGIPIKCYIHLSNNKTRSILRAQNLLFNKNSSITYSLFSTPNSTARNLFSHLFLRQDLGILSYRNSNTKSQNKEMPVNFKLPGKDEAFHLFIFGFGEIGQSIALHTAHFAHFESCLRPRITIFEDEEQGMKPWRTFTDQYSAFSPRELDLSSTKFSNSGDGWDTHNFRPYDAAYRTWNHKKNKIPEVDRTRQPNEDKKEYSERIKQQEEEQEFRILQNHAVEYAVHAEYKPILTDVESCELLNKICERLAVTTPKVRAAIVFCAEDERKNFNNALRLQQELARRLLENDPNTGELQCRNQIQRSQFPIPLYVLLPEKKGLVKLLSNSPGGEGAGISKIFPIYPFGEQEKNSTYGIITNSNIKNYATGFRDIYETLAGKKLETLADFETSDLEAALFAELKLKALGITFRGGEENSKTGIFAEYYTQEVENLFKVWPEGNGEGSIRKLSYQEFKKVITNNANTSPKMLLLERLLVLGKLKIKGEQKSEIKTLSDIEKNNLLHLKSEVIAQFLTRFKKESKYHKLDLELAAKIEHNRWMGERLAKNWKFGRRDKHRRQRKSFVPWEYVPKWDEQFREELLSRNNLKSWTKYQQSDLKNYDRQQLLLLILALRERGWIAYASKK